MAPEDLLAVGRIARAHGIRGEVSVHPLSEVEARFEPGSVLLLEDGRTLTVESSRTHQRRVLVKFEGVPDRNAAEGLRGEVLLVPESEVPAPPEGSWWPHQLIGCAVVTEDGKELGPLTEVLTTPANDVWVTETAMIPAVHDVVREVDVAGRRIVVADIEGLEFG